MNHSRREAIKAGGGAGLLATLIAIGLVKPGSTWATEWNKGAFQTKSIADALKSLGASAPTMTPDIVLNAPDHAENGATVQVGVVSNLPNTQQIVYLIEKNPNTLAAIFDIPPGTLPEVVTKVKFAHSSNLMVLVKADGKFYAAQKEVRVTIGGCG